MLNRIASSLIIALVSASMLTSCSSTKLVKITVDPPEATITLDGETVGTGSFIQKIDFGDRPNYTFTASLDKYADKTFSVRYEPKTQTDYQIELQRLYSITVPLVEFGTTTTPTGITPGLKKASTIAYYDITEESSDAKGLARVTNNQESNIFYGGPVLAPTEDFMLYGLVESEEGKNNTQILMQKVGSTSTTLVVEEKRALVLFPTLNADSTGYIFCSNRITGKYALWRRKFKGTGRTKLSGGFSQDFSSSISPNGSKVAYTCLPTDGEELQIWTIDTNSGLSTQLGTGIDPEVSPDGKHILFLQKAPGSSNTQIWMMDFEGGDRTQLTDNVDFSVKDPRWSPDGTMITYAANNGKDDKDRQNFDIWMMKADGSDAQQLTQNGSHDDKPCFDRHGDRIYFRSNRGTHWNIWSFKLNKRYSKARQGFEM